MARRSTQMIFHPRQLMWLISLRGFDASGLFKMLFDLQHLPLACGAKMETNSHSSAGTRSASLTLHPNMGKDYNHLLP